MDSNCNYHSCNLNPFNSSAVEITEYIEIHIEELSSNKIVMPEHTRRRHATTERVSRVQTLPTFGNSTWTRPILCIEILILYTAWTLPPFQPRRRSCARVSHTTTYLPRQRRSWAVNRSPPSPPERRWWWSVSGARWWAGPAGCRWTSEGSQTPSKEPTITGIWWRSSTWRSEWKLDKRSWCSCPGSGWTRSMTHPSMIHNHIQLSTMEATPTGHVE